MMVLGTQVSWPLESSPTRQRTSLERRRSLSELEFVEEELSKPKESFLEELDCLGKEAIEFLIL